MTGPQKMSVKVADQFLQDDLGSRPLLGQLLIREINLGLQQRERVDQSQTPAVDQTGDAAPQLLERPAVLLGGFRRKKIGKPLGLGEIEPLVDNCPTGEFPRLGRAETGEPGKAGQQMRSDSTASMHLQLSDILARRTRGTGKPENHAMIDRIPAVRVKDPLHGKTIAAVPTREGKNGRSRIRTRYSNDTDC